MTDITTALETVRDRLCTHHTREYEAAALTALSTIETELTRLRAERDEAVADRDEAEHNLAENEQGLAAVLAERDEAVAALRGLVTAVSDVAGNLSTYSTQQESIDAALRVAARLSTPKDSGSQP